ncbi:MAG: ATP-binding protein, partial [Bacteroidota bacterium]
FFSASEIRRKKNKDDRMLVINNTAMGTLSREKKEYEQALKYFEQAVEISKRMRDKDLEGYSYIYYGEIYAEIGQEIKAENYLLDAKRIFEELGSETRLLNVYASLSGLYNKQKRYEEANEIASKGLELSHKLNDSHYYPIFYESLTSAKSALRDFEGAFLLQKDFMIWRDSLNAKKKDERILEIETEYQLKGIAAENEVLKAVEKQQRTQLRLQSLIFIFVLASLVFVALTLLGLNRKNKELKLANEKVIESSKVKQEFLSTMSHEIRTPLNVVIGFTELLATEEPRKDQLEYVNGLKASSQHLLELINNVLDFSKIEAKKLELEHIPFDLREQLQSIISTYQLSNTNDQLSIELHSDLNLNKLIIGDPTRLYQILSNLLSNAVKFTTEGLIRLEVTTLEQLEEEVRLQFVVSDTGIGIPESKQQLIFEDFIQGSNATTREFGGSGLGLSICQQLLKLMGGHIELESELGKGSKFKFNLTFPLSQLQSKTNLVNPTINAKEEPLKNQKILLAEDNLLNQKIALTILQKHGATVTIANNGKEALELVQQQDFDLVLMDLHMPVMDGFEAIDRIKKLPYPKKDTHIIVLTATASDDELNYPIEFIQKPFNIDQLISVIKQNLRLA